jgi:crossover junction endodeoxyribonuclease RuvC
MRILGIDPGTAAMGYGIVEVVDEPCLVEYGVLSSSRQLALPQRLLRLFGLFELLEALIERFEPDAVAVEELFFARNVTTAFAVGQARGVVLLAAARHNLPVAEYKPAEVKQAVVGYGRADKPQVQQMVQIALGLGELPRPDDAADALAIALCHAQTTAFRDRLTASG